MNQYSLWLRRYLIVFLVVCWTTIFMEKAIAIPKDNPLMFDRQDPLIPKGYDKRQLSSFEEFRIEREISRLKMMAESEYNRGNLDRAMELWYRQLRLTRAIDKQGEIVSLGEIGAIAWQENRSQDLNHIANRLIAIQGQLERSNRFDLQLHNSLAMAYEGVRYVDKAIDVYQEILEKGNRQLKSDREREIVDRLGELYLAIFDYPNAAKIYQQKFAENPEGLDRELQLQRLIRIYEKGRLNNKAIATRKLLIEQYQQEQKSIKIPTLKMANGRDWESLGKFDSAIDAYQEVFTAASKMQQLALAGDALDRVGNLYRQQENLERAIDTYQTLLVVRQQADNYYDAIDTYDTLGEIHLQLEKPKVAKKFFELGLKQAQELNYKVAYFRRKLERLN